MQACPESAFCFDPQIAESLLTHAVRPGDLAALAFAGIIAVLWRADRPMSVPILGIDRESFSRLLSQHFGDAGNALAARLVDGVPHPVSGRYREFTNLRDLLIEHCTTISEESEWLACTVATGSLGENHLWQDLGLPSRKELSRLLMQNFTALAAKNVTDMRWKKFFYKQLCDRAGVNLCKAPSCSECVDYDLCFGPEDKTFPIIAETATVRPWMNVSK